MKKVRNLAVVVLLCALVVCITVIAAGESIKKNVDIFYKNIKICVDGTYIEPKDADGNAVEPFIMDGTTYLPVRAVANAFGKDVEWDGETSTVYLGKKNTEAEADGLEELFRKYHEADNYQTVTVMKNLPLFGNVIMTIKTDGNKTFTSGVLGAGDTYTEIVDGEMYLYTQDENGNWIKNVTQAEETDEAQNEALYNADNYVKTGEGIYEYIGDVEIENTKDITLTIEDDKYIWKLNVISNGIVVEATIEVSEIGTTTVILPEISEAA